MAFAKTIIMDLIKKKYLSPLECFFFVVLFLHSAGTLSSDNFSSREANFTSAEQPPAPELQVKAFRTLGTGKADSSTAAINPPDGLAFTRNGLLVATDAMNHRIQIFNPCTGKHLGHAGDSGLITGLIINVISLPDDGLLVSDETANQAYRFKKATDDKVGYRLSSMPLFKEDGFMMLNGLACDAKKRIYVVDGLMGEVRRYLLPDFKPDPNWKFLAWSPDKKPVLNRSEGIAIDEKTGTLFATDEREGIIHAFSLETGQWLGKTIGRQADATGKPLGQSVFHRSVEGLAVMGDYLLAVDEGQADPAVNHPGHLLVFYLRSPALYKTGAEECRKRMESGVVDGLVGWFGYYRSPDGAAVFPGDGNSEAMVAVADQGAYQILVYFWKDVLEALQKANKEK